MGDGIILHRSNGWYPAFTFTPTDPEKAPGYEFVQDDVTFDYEAWKEVPIKDGTAVFQDNGISLTSIDDDAYTEYDAETFPEAARILVLPGEVIILSWDEETNVHGNVWIYPNGNEVGSVSVDNANVKQLRYAVPSGVSFLTFRFGVAAFDRTIHYKNITFHSVNKNWRLRLLTSGTLKFNQLNSARRGVDIFLVGGGGGGVQAIAQYGYSSHAGGGSGYAITHRNKAIQKDIVYNVVIGQGGAYGKDHPGTESRLYSEQSTLPFDLKAAGGGGTRAAASYYDDTGSAFGGDGGSGGYAVARVINGNYNGRHGGSDGADGWKEVSGTAGKGQRNTPGPNGETGSTREFGDPTGTLYAEGGGSQDGTPQIANTGNGGNANTGGCSGIIIIRNAR